MENGLVALIAAAGAIGGSALTGVITYRLARLERKARDKDELRSALVAYGAALDRLTLRIEQLPQAHGIEEGWTNKLVAKWPTLDWAMGRLSTAILGRGMMRAVDEVIAATNRLLLIAPEPILDEMGAVSELIGGFEPGVTKWREEWQAARSAFAGASRRAVIESPSNRWVKA
ncbi:MAG: hypothetical protein ACM3N0_11970 [Chloroflexota bacterium]